MNGGSHYTGWFHKSEISYDDYLQGKEFERSIRYGIEDQTKQLIASNEQLARENYEALEHINDGINSGFTMLSADIDRLNNTIDSGFERIATIFEWGFSEVLISLGRVNDSLDALIKIARTPAQTWAYEQFEIARDEFRRGLYNESLESVLRAINGYGSNPGYKTEFRFHFLQGTIRLGSFKNSDLQLVDTADSEAAFLKAARYARNDLPVEAARALLCAGRAAYVQKNADKSLEYSTDAISLNPELIEAYFQSAQALCVLGRPQDSVEHLVTAIIHEHEYAIKAANDADICQYPEMLKKALTTAKNKLKLTYEQEKNNYVITLNKVKNTDINGYAVNSICIEQLDYANKYENEFNNEASKENIFGYVQAANLAREGIKVIKSVVASFQSLSSNIINEEQRKLEAGINDIGTEINKIHSTIANIDSTINSSKPKDYETIDIVLGGAILAGLLLINIPANAIGPVIIGIAILSGLTGGLTILILIPPAKFIYFIRKIIWKTEESKAQSRKQQLRNTIGTKAEPQKQQLQQKINELNTIKNRIASFAMPE